jgi:hypothetical protein
MEIKARDYIKPENSFWFQWDGSKPTTFTAVSLGDQNRLQVGRFEDLDFLYGYIIPTSLYQASPEARAVSPRHPLQSLTEVLRDILPTYQAVDKSRQFEENWQTLSPVFAAQARGGLCYDRASIGLAIARAAGIEARVMGHDGLLKSRLEIRINQLLQRRIFQGIGHYWLEVKQDNRWTILETAAGALRQYNANIDERYVCAEVPVCQMVSKGFLRQIGVKDYNYQPPKIC